MSKAGIVWLMYHELELPGRPTCHAEAGYRRYVVSGAEFHQQMRGLHRDRWHGMNVSEGLANPLSPGVVITFDDGCETDLTTAAPLLKELNFNATFYITVGFLDRPGYLSRSQLRELADCGFEIGCHSYTHPYLPDLGADDLKNEVVHARKELEQLTGSVVEHFSCPGGRWDSRVRDEVKKAGYRSMTTSCPVPNRPDSDRWTLGRVAIMRRTIESDFQRLARGQGLWKIRLNDSTRAAVRSVLGNSLYDRMRNDILDRSSS